MAFTTTPSALTFKLFFKLTVMMTLIGLIASQEENILNIEPPKFFQYNSPLSQPDSLRSRPYFDFLSTLYRHDNSKSDLFRPYLNRQRREVPVDLVSFDALQQIGAVEEPRTLHKLQEFRPKRAIVFRPLFVYKQQQIRKQEIAKRRRV